VSKKIENNKELLANVKMGLKLNAVKKIEENKLSKEIQA